jgi:hypothetical protein
MDSSVSHGFEAGESGARNWRSDDSDTPRSLRLEIVLEDAEMIGALLEFPEGRERNQYVRTALKIGLLALGQVQGRVDADTVRNEGERLIETMKERLDQTQYQIDTLIGQSLKSYFDPGSGRFTERVERLVKQDGDLERVMRAQTQLVAQSLAETLTRHVGEASPLMTLLAPDDSNRFIAALRGNVEQTLAIQTGQVLKEFSLDNPEGALARLVRELTEKHGSLTENLQERIDDVVGEFSLDSPDSALSRLVGRVEQAQKTISAEFSLDAENSALARMRRELMGVLDTHKEATNAFQQQVLAALEGMKARKEESARSTTHGHEFQNQVFSFIEQVARKAGDIAEDVGETAGSISRSKVGDAVITLGPDCVAAGTRIAIEAKESGSYTLKSTLEESAIARKNRDAQVGLFVHSRRTAPEGLEPIARYGDDIVVLWDAEDEATDAYLKAGLIVAKSIAVKTKVQSEAQAHDLKAMESSVADILKQAALLEDVTTWTNTIKSSAEKVLQRVDKVRGQLLVQGEALEDQVGRLGA